jgi:hypothetical protein
MPANQNFIPGVTGWTGMNFMPNPDAHAAAATKLSGGNLYDPNMGAIPQTNTANNIAGQIGVPPTNTQSGTAPPQVLNDPSLGSNPSIAGQGAGLTPIITATQFGTNNIPSYLTGAVNNLSNSWNNNQQWFDLIGKIIGTYGQSQFQQPDPATDLLKTRIMAEHATGGPAATRARQMLDLANNTTNPNYNAGSLWGNSTNRQLQDQSMFYSALAHRVTPQTMTWNSGNQTTNYQQPTYQPPSSRATGWSPRMPSI